MSMKRLLGILLLVFILMAAVSCDGAEDGAAGANDSGGAAGANDSGGADTGIDTSIFVLKAKVTAQASDGRIEVEVIDSDYAFGIYWVLINNETRFLDQGGGSISAEDIKVGDTVEISYGGQVMMSYPPQIVAKKIKLA